MASVPRTVLEELNEGFKDLIQRRDTENIHVLILYWDDGDQGFKDEGQAVRGLFENTFNYHVTEFPIPSVKSEPYLLRAVIDVFLDDPSLVIIYYGGHGDKDDDRHNNEERRAVWAAHRHGGPELKWYKIQKSIVGYDTDILLLLDCCFAGQASRARIKSTSRFEILAAAAMSMETTSYGSGSFTTAMIQNMKEAVLRTGHVVIKDLHNTLEKAQQGLFAQPVHSSLKSGHPIRLEPLSLEVAGNKGPPKQELGSFLQLFIHVKQELTQEKAELLTNWLAADVPRVVSRLDIFDRTEHLRKTMQEIQQRQKGFLELENESRLETLEAWDRVVDLFQRYPAQAPNKGVEREIVAAKRGAEFMEQLDQGNNEVARLLERNILTSPAIEDEVAMREALEDDNMEVLGIARQLNMRRVVNSADYQEHDISLIPTTSNDKNDGHVIQEYKVYGPYVDPKQIAPRVELLARLLATPKQGEFRSLRCLGLSHQEFENKFTLDFEVPDRTDGPQFESLHTIIRKYTGTLRPSLDARLRIALQLATAVEKWHLVGWLHQGISSHNVIFFFKNRSGRVIDYSRPYLHGFEYARPSNDPSLGRPGEDEEMDLYRHPARQGVTSKGHQRVHDYYSLGVLLLEIGLWQSATSIVKKHRKDEQKQQQHQQQQPISSGYEGSHAQNQDQMHSYTQKSGPYKVQDVLLENCTERVAHYAGEGFQSVAKVCLTGDFGIDLDDERGSRLIRAFHDRVVDPLKKGISP